MYRNSLPQARTASATHLYSALLVALALLVRPVLVLRAGEIYKSVDAEGHVVYSDRADTSPQSAIQIDDAQTPPRVIHFCWTNCFTLSFDNGLYRRTDGSDETWTVERFTSTAVILHRHGVPAAWNGFSADVTYQGQVSNGRLIGVTVNGNPVPDINMGWGAALDTLPGSNAERDQGMLAQPKTQATSVSPPTSDIEPAGDVDMRAAEAPPPLLNDGQPPCPEEGVLWTPGYWAWRGGYYWVPGVWVLPPRVGLLWTPGYWGFAGAAYAFHRGYWGPHIGFYGGINYGYGYVGVGFAGGRWVGNSFAYNRSVNNVDTSVIHNTYNEAVVNNVALNKVSYNGGPGGTTAAATAQERAAAAEPHMPPTSSQREIIQLAAGNPALVAHANDGHPVIAVTHRPAASSAPRVPGIRATAPAAAHATAAPTMSDPPNLAHVPPNTAAHPLGAAAQPATAKPAGAKPAKPLPQRKQ